MDDVVSIYRVLSNEFRRRLNFEENKRSIIAIFEFKFKEIFAEDV